MENACKYFTRNERKAMKTFWFSKQGAQFALSQFTKCLFPCLIIAVSDAFEWRRHVRPQCSSSNHHHTFANFKQFPFVNSKKNSYHTKKFDKHDSLLHGWPTPRQTLTLVVLLPPYEFFHRIIFSVWHQSDSCCLGRQKPNESLHVQQSALCILYDVNSHEFATFHFFSHAHTHPSLFASMRQLKKERRKECRLRSLARSFFQLARSLDKCCAD